MSQTDISELNTRFGIPDQVRFELGPGGLPVVEVRNRQARASIALQGAQVLRWAPVGAEPVIWLSPDAKFAPGKSVRGGVPVCWPWFGPHPSETSYPGHGYARTVGWQPTSVAADAAGTTRLEFQLMETEATRAQWPHRTPVSLAVQVGSSLEFELVTRNEGDAPVVIGDALHTYFQVGDVRRIEILGLESCPYLDKVGGGRQVQHGPVRIEAETDRIYLESSADCLIVDPVLQRRIRIEKRGSRSSVVWNPWIEKSAKMGDFGPDGYLRMVCVESTNAADDVVRIAPGGEHRLWVRYSLESLG